MHAQTLPQTKPFLSSAAFTFAGSMCDGSSTGISTVSKPHFLNLGNSFTLSVVKGDVNKNVLMPILIDIGFVKRVEAKETRCRVKRELLICPRARNENFSHRNVR